jgi:hypothetical protein|eukprot:Stramenopile-MAST_4_protein_1600
MRSTLTSVFLCTSVFLGWLRDACALSLPSASFSSETIHFSRCGVCKALARELHLEVLRHDLNAGGEEDILDSAEAACLGVVRNYTIVGVGAAAKVLHSPEEDRIAAGYKTDVMETALLVKHVCEQVSDEVSMELSEAVWRGVVRGNEPGKTATDLCVNRTELCAPSARVFAKKKKEENDEKKKQTPKKKNAMDIDPNTEEGMREMFEKLDADGSITAMLQKEQDEPEMMLPEKDQQDVKQASGEILCSTCVALIQGTVTAGKRSPGGRALRSEADLERIVEKICEGPPDPVASHSASLLGISPPPLPPSWTGRYKVVRAKSTGRWELRKRSKPLSNSKSMDRKRWSSKIAKDKFTMTKACKLVVNMHEDRLSEGLFRMLQALPTKCLHVKPGQRDDKACIIEDADLVTNVCYDHCGGSATEVKTEL